VKGKAVAIIPARYASTRLPGKPLLPINGKPMIVHVAERASLAGLVSRVIVATDDERIVEAVTSHGFEARLTSKEARSGTDRIAEVAAALEADIIANIQGDEPLIAPASIDAAITPLTEDPDLQMSTTSEPISEIADVFNTNIVKVVCDSRDYALYFSRSPIPYIRPAPGASLEEYLTKNPHLISNYRKHSGLYVYRHSFLLRYAQMTVSCLESLELLEQLRVIENGFRIKVVKVEHRSIGVDTPEDLDKIHEQIKEKRK
jgi:3-deoxy-manno-octulosonate cytidylyltransferase (CMP-KDO synthetase)